MRSKTQEAITKVFGWPDASWLRGMKDVNRLLKVDDEGIMARQKLCQTVNQVIDADIKAASVKLGSRNFQVAHAYTNELLELAKLEREICDLPRSGTEHRRDIQMVPRSEMEQLLQAAEEEEVQIVKPPFPPKSAITRVSATSKAQQQAIEDFLSSEIQNVIEENPQATAEEIAETVIQKNPELSSLLAGEEQELKKLFEDESKRLEAEGIGKLVQPPSSDEEMLAMLEAKVEASKKRKEVAGKRKERQKAKEKEVRPPEPKKAKKKKLSAKAREELDVKTKTLETSAKELIDYWNGLGDAKTVTLEEPVTPEENEKVLELRLELMKDMLDVMLAYTQLESEGIDLPKGMITMRGDKPKENDVFRKRLTKAHNALRHEMLGTELYPENPFDLTDNAQRQLIMQALVTTIGLEGELAEG